jgi:hypothetical protein
MNKVARIPCYYGRESVPDAIRLGPCDLTDPSTYRAATVRERFNRSRRTHMKIGVLGGDGYCGWATALYLSAKGHEVAIVDNFSRRQWDHELGVETLTPIRPLAERLKVWQQHTGRTIELFVGDVTDYDFLSSTIQAFEPEAVIHFAEQRAAPYSMIDRKHAVFTQVNNVVGTLNLLFAIREYPARVPPGEAGDHGRVRHAQHRYRRRLHQDRA